MKKYKICVYAICKNEEQFIDRWYESMKEADKIYVLDTGSTDNTLNKLKEKGIIVKQKIIEPWRFDVARNESLKMISDNIDICVCTDLDEVFEKGWRKLLEEKWNKKITRIRYTYNWSLDEKNNPIVSFMYEKIHCKKDFEWVNPVHEILKYNGIEKVIDIPSITLNHYPDKNKSRSSYLPLLELSVREDPTNDRNMHYLGREYMYYGRWNESIDTLIKHLSLPTSLWKDERSASMRFIARCYQNLNRFEEAKMWLEKAILEAPYLRDPLMEKALMEYSLGNNDEVENLVLKALKIPINQKTYINEVFTFDHTAYDLLSLVYYEKKEKAKALEYINKRLKQNLKYIEKME